MEREKQADRQAGCEAGRQVAQSAASQPEVDR
jgi:hypothetical protein